jgi:hypothetical protein
MPLMVYHASVSEDEIVSLQMINVSDINKQADYTFLNWFTPSRSISNGFRKL